MKKAVKQKRENHQSVFFIPMNSFTFKRRVIDAVEMLGRAKLDV